MVEQTKTNQELEGLLQLVNEYKERLMNVNEEPMTEEQMEA